MDLLLSIVIFGGLGYIIGNQRNKGAHGAFWGGVFGPIGLIGFCVYLFISERRKNTSNPIGEIDPGWPAPIVPESPTEPGPVYAVNSGWFNDPTNKHFIRYHDGFRWTQWVSEGDEVIREDPM